MNIGFVGTGIMGSRMAANLLKAGHSLTVYNRTREKAEPLIAKGAKRALTPADTADGVDGLVTMLAHPHAVRDAALGESGFLNHLPPGAFWMDCSTVNPSFSREMAAAAMARGLRFLDAPVGGSKAPAESGELIFLVGADPEDLKRCEPLLNAMGSKTVHIGPPGMGCAMKLVFNLLLGTAMAGFSEALHLGQTLGVSKEMLLNALPGTAVVAPFITHKKPKIADGEFEAEFPLKWMHKDLHLVCGAAYDHQIALPLANAVKETFAKAVETDLGESDFSAVYRLFRKE